MRLASVAAGMAILTVAPVAEAQNALTATSPLRIAAIGQTRVVMVQGAGADPFVWEWTFLDEEAEGDGETFDTYATSVMYDCAARTRRALVLETYRDGSFVSETPLYEEPAPVPPGTLANGALEVICEPETNSDGAVFPDIAAARSAMDDRLRATQAAPR